MALGREPGTDAAIEEREAPSQRLYRGHRLSGRAGTGEERHSGAGEGFAVGTESRESICSRADRGREKLYRLCAGAEGLPGRIFGFLHTGCGAVPRFGAGAGRWEFPQSAGAIEPD